MTKNKYTVSLDLIVPVLLEIEALSAEDAEDILYGMAKRELLRLANTEEDGVCISEDSVCVEERET